jgi:hypothetical protein
VLVRTGAGALPLLPLPLALPLPLLPAGCGCCGLGRSMRLRRCSSLGVQYTSPQPTVSPSPVFVLCCGGAVLREGFEREER